MSKYQINYKMEFKTRPSKYDVECKLFDLLKNAVFWYSRFLDEDIYE